MTDFQPPVNLHACIQRSKASSGMNQKLLPIDELCRCFTKVRRIKFEDT